MAVDQAQASYRWELGRRPALDGVRGVALMMVFVGHAGWPWTPNRAHEFGVELFFVLSGFLITALLIQEHRNHGFIAVRAFYIRRVRRLLPALLALLILLFFVVETTHLFDRGPSRAGLIGGATYSSGILAAKGRDLGPLAHLWSLSVEEHFYLLWPLIAAVALSKRVSSERGTRNLLVTTVVLLGVSLLWRWWLASSDYGLEWTRLYTATDSRVSAPLFGCILAVALTRLRFAVPGWLAAVALLAGSLCLAWLSTQPTITTFPMYWTRALPLADVAATLVCFGAATTHNPLASALSTAPLRWLGRLSYAAYLWHYPIFILVGGQLTTMSTAETAGAVTATMAVAAVSERFVERRFRTRHGLAGSPEVRQTASPIG